MAICPRCGAEAEWSFFNPGKNEVEVMCPDCGRFPLSREEFDQATSDRAQIEEIERR
ncbi:MAG TPA: hypothetical protein VKV17_01305 [Bryobacteraceae bacterium]|nr:hypothetical protein [Bryobacteraceae bacterium]